jgi:hypothetical protein
MGGFLPFCELKDIVICAMLLRTIYKILMGEKQMKKIVLDVKAIFGDLFYLEHEPVYKYENDKKTDQVIGYNYNLLSTGQGDIVKIKVIGDEKEFEPMQKVELVELETTKIFARNNFADVRYSLTAHDIKNSFED